MESCEKLDRILEMYQYQKNKVVTKDHGAGLLLLQHIHAFLFLFWLDNLLHMQFCNDILPWI